MMIKRGIQKMLTRMQQRCDYDLTYLNDIVCADTKASGKSGNETLMPSSAVLKMAGYF